jgi:drug/metabolite transporter (DMT)-like permease
MTFLSDHHKGALYAISSGLCYGLLGYFGMSVIKADFSVYSMLFWRFFVATLFMALLLVPQYKHLLREKTQLSKAFVYGLLFYGSSTTLYFMSSQYIGTGLAMVIFFTFPAMVMLINIVFYKATIHKIYYLAFAMIVIGMSLLVNPQSMSFDLYGIGLGVLCAFLYACYIAASKKITVPPMLSTLMVSGGCMLTALTFSLFDHSFKFPSDFSTYFNLICMGLICTAIPILLLLQAFKYLSSEKASMLSVLEPVFVVIFGIILLEEEVHGLEFVGILIILSGALITLFSDNKKTV